MTPRLHASWLLAVSLLSTTALPAPAWSQAAAAPAAALESEFETAAASLKARLLEQCVPQGAALAGGEKIGFGLPPSHQIAKLAPDQSNNFMLQIDEAFRKLQATTPDLVYMPTFRLDEVTSAAPRERQEYRQKVEAATHLRVTPSVIFEGDQVKFTLKADPVPGGKLEMAFICGVASDTRHVPPEVIGDRFYTPAELFRRFAGGIYDRLANEPAQLEVVSTDNKVEPLSDEAVSVLLKEFNEQKSSNFSIGADPTPIQVLKRAGHEPARDPAGSRWTVELKLIEQTREAKLIVTATPSNPKAQAFAEQGLVRLASLPAQSTRSLQAVAITGAAASLSKSRAAMLLPVGVGLQRLSARLEGKESLPFSMAFEEPSILEVDIEQSVKRTLVLLDGSGREVRPAFVGSGRPNLRRYALAQGRYVLIVANPESAATDFVLRTRTARTMLEPEPPGDLTRTFGDWAVGISSAQGRRVCFAYTTAGGDSAVRRLQRPVIWFSTESEKEAPLAHFVDDARFYRNPVSTRAVVAAAGQALAPISLSEIEGRLVPAQLSAAGQPVLSDASIRAFTLGRAMVLTGTDEQGKDSRVVYSLIGYRQAITSMATLCGRPELAQKLVW
jgi:hypothetical protein